MTAQIDLRFDAENRREQGSNKTIRKSASTRKPRRGLWFFVLLIAIAVAGVVGVAVAAHGTDSPGPTGVVTQQANPNSRDDGVPTSAAEEPNPNHHEDALPTSAAQEPNPNHHEDALPTTAAQEPNPNHHEDALPDSALSLR